MDKELKEKMREACANIKKLTGVRRLTSMETYYIYTCAEIAATHYESKWVRVDSEEKPKLKPGWGYSEKVLVWYEGVPNVKVEGYGIAYYHPQAPHNGSEWVDFNNYGRKPYKWQYIIDTPPNSPLNEGEKTEKE